MAHYRNQTTNQLLCVPDDSIDAWIPEGFELISEADADAHRSGMFVKPSLKDKAIAELHKLTAPSGTVMRCYMAGIAFPADWQAYRAALLAIANGTDTTSTVLPAQPAYPAGT